MLNQQEFKETIEMLGELDEVSLRLVKSGVELLYAREKMNNVSDVKEKGA